MEVPSVKHGAPERTERRAGDDVAHVVFVVYHPRSGNPGGKAERAQNSHQQHVAGVDVRAEPKGAGLSGLQPAEAE